MAIYNDNDGCTCNDNYDDDGNWDDNNKND